MNLLVKPSSFFTLIVISLLLSACHSGEMLNPMVSKTISDPIQTQWLGFGYNQDPLDRNKEGHDIGSWDKGRWELTKERVNYIRPSLVRINLYRHWFNPSGVVGVYEWDSPAMQSLYQVLDYYKEKNIPVMTGLWQSTLDYKDDVPFYTTEGPGSFQQMQVDMFQQLYNVKGYQTIKWYTPTNEPKGTGMDFQKWSLMMRNTYQGFLAASLPVTKFTGADSWEEWTSSAATYNNMELSAYDHHYYLNSGINQVIYGDLEEQFKMEVDNVRKIDAGNKPIFLSEVGFTTTSELDYWFVLNPIPSLTPKTFTYGLLALDYGIQVARSGESGALAWSLDGYDYGKDPGMWNIAGNNGGIQLRPWYYAWSLLCRYFPATGIMHSIPFESRLTRGIAIKLQRGNQSHWTFGFVNWEEKEVEVEIKVPLFKGGDFAKFQYSEFSSGDGSSVSLPTEKLNIKSLEEGFTIKIPAKGGVILTSMENAPISVQ